VRNFFDEKWGETRELGKRRKSGELKKIRKGGKEERRESERFLKSKKVMRRERERERERFLKKKEQKKLRSQAIALAFKKKRKKK
jgi:hypothetical protein